MVLNVAKNWSPISKNNDTCKALFDIFTNHIRRIREAYVFHRRLSIHSGEERGVNQPGPDGGREVTPSWSRPGYRSGQDQGGVPPSQDQNEGTPLTRDRNGVPPQSKPVGPPPPQWRSRGGRGKLWTVFAAVGTPLVVSHMRTVIVSLQPRPLVDPPLLPKLSVRP